MAIASSLFLMKSKCEARCYYAASQAGAHSELGDAMIFSDHHVRSPSTPNWPKTSTEAKKYAIRFRLQQNRNTK